MERIQSVRTLLARLLFLVTSLLLLSACDAFSSRQAPSNPPVPAAVTPAFAAQPTPLPQGACQARLFGKVTNSSNNQSPANALVQIASSGKTLQTVTDQNGLYGFAGLCAGEYAMTLTPPGGKPIANPNKVSLSSSTALKVDLPYR